MLFRHARSSYEKNGSHLRTMFRELWDVLMECARDPEAGEIICVLDALDECNELARKDLITQLCCFYSAQNQRKTKLKFLATSRPYYDIERVFYSSIDDMSTVRLKGEYESEKISREIDLVINHQIPLISKSRHIPLKPEVQNALIEYLTKLPNRTYLWLHFVLDVIRKSLDSTAIRLERLINKLPLTVEDAYEKILARIDGSESAKQARRLLHIMVAAARPLTLQEMSIAISIDENLERGQSCQSYDDLDLEAEEEFRERVRNICGLFVTIADSKIYLIHQTAKEFLVSENIVSTSTNSVSPNPKIWKHSLDPIESNLVLVKICVSYLLFDEHNRQIAENEYFQKNILSHKILDYAANHWVTHCHQSKIKDSHLFLQSILDVCDPQSNRFQRWSLISWPLFDFPQIPRLAKVTNLMIASYLGLKAIVKLLLQQDGVNLNLMDSANRTALSCAAYKGHSEVVKLLLEQNKIDLNLGGINSSTPLMKAARKGHVEVVKLLLEQDGVELNLKDNDGSTALSRAAGEGHAEVVKLLIEQDKVKLNLRDDDGQTVLGLAAYRGHAEAVKLLIKHNKIELNLKDGVGYTPLLWAAYEGRADVVGLLIEQDGIELNFKDRSGYTALTWAAHRGYAEVVKLLLKQKDIELAPSDRTPLMLAKQHEHMEVVSLLEKGRIEN